MPRMYTKMNVSLLLFTLMLVSGVVSSLSPPFIIQLSHNEPEAASFKMLEDGDMAFVQPLSRYQKRDVVTEPINIAGNSVIVTCKISMGSSKAPFIVLLDTGSPLLALPTPGCQCDSGAPNAPYSLTSNALSCSDSRCKSCCKKGVCDESTCGFGITYADGTSLNGSVYQDVIELGGIKSTVLFGGITQQSPSFVAPHADGIIGFSLDGSISCIPSCIPPVFSVFVSNGLVANSFGIYLDYAGAGELSMGGIDTSITTEPFHYTPLKEKSNHFRVDLNAVRLNGTDTGMGSMEVLLDTGTTYMLLPKKQYQALVDFFKANYCHLTGVCSQANIFNGNCLLDASKLEQFPDLTFQFAGVQVRVPPSAYFLQTAMRGRSGYCFSIISWPDPYAILGNAFMRGHYIFYDIENRRIGFASSNTTVALDKISSAFSLFPSLLAVLSVVAFSLF